MLDAPVDTVYEGQFGNFTIDREDRIGVVIYRGALMLSACSFAIATGLVLSHNLGSSVLTSVTYLYALFCLGLGVSLLTIHIYLIPLHRLLQAFWVVGVVASIGLTLSQSLPLALLVYQQPLTLFGVGFVFAALTGIFFKEAFCFQRLETLGLTFLVPGLLIGHLLQVISVEVERPLLATWAFLYLVFAARKCFQAIPADIGDKSVFTYLKSQTATSPEHR